MQGHAAQLSAHGVSETSLASAESAPGVSTPLGTWLEGHEASAARPAFPPPFSSTEPRSVTLALDASDSSELWVPAGPTVTGSSVQTAESAESSFDVHRLRPQAPRTSSTDPATARSGGPVAESGRRPVPGRVAVQGRAELRVATPTRSHGGTASEASPATLTGSPRREQQELLPRDRADSTGPALPPAAASAAEYVSRLQLQGHIVDRDVEMVRLPATPVFAEQLRSPVAGGAASQLTQIKTPPTAVSTGSTARRGPPTHVSWSQSPRMRRTASIAGGAPPASARSVGRLRRLSRSSAADDERGSWATGNAIKLSGMTRHRAYDVAVEVKSGLAKSCFRYTKMLHLKDKYILENCTGETLEVRDRGLSALQSVHAVVPTPRDVAACVAGEAAGHARPRRAVRAWAPLGVHPCGGRAVAAVLGRRIAAAARGRAPRRRRPGRLGVVGRVRARGKGGLFWGAHAPPQRGGPPRQRERHPARQHQRGR